MLNTKTIAELKQFCDDFGIQYTKNARKQDVISVIEESGLTFDDYEGSSLGFKDYVPEVKEEVIEEVEVIKEPEVSNEFLILTTISGVNAYIHGINLVDDRYAFVEKNLAQKLLNEPSYGVREASVEEYNNFHGIR